MTSRQFEITTTAIHEMSGRRFTASRHEVTTLEGRPGEPLDSGAQYVVDMLIEEHGGSLDEWPNLTEQGGTVGPLPDGTVITVERKA